MSPFTVWQCPEPGCEESDFATWHSGRASMGCYGAGHPKAGPVELFSVEEIRERLLSKEALNAAVRTDLSEGEFDRLRLADQEVHRYEWEDGIAAALTHAFPTQQEQGDGHDV